MDKIRAQRNFVNKIWNASRFILTKFPQASLKLPANLSAADKKILKQLNRLIKSTTKNIQNYRFGQASEDLYQFFWHQFCDLYLESTKNRTDDPSPVLLTVLLTSLKLLHPFAPFVTESIYQILSKNYSLSEPILASASWPHEIDY